jgi:protein-S-isoprenylcysteine O-methyltransferase Ste14
MLATAGLGVTFRGDWGGAWASVAGAGCFLAAAGFGLGGALALRSQLTPYPQPGAQAVLVTQGVYGWVRHPLYTSVAAAALGWGLLWRSGPALLGALALALFFLAKARREERWLRARFPGYADYARRVKAFLPGLF